MIARKSFSTGAIYVVMAFLMGMVFGCASTQSPKAPQMSEIKPYLPHSIGYIRVLSMSFHKPPKKISSALLLAQTEEGKKWFTIERGGRVTVFLHLTQYALDNGAFKDGLEHFIPAGKIETTILEQKVDPYLAEGTWEWKAKVSLKVTELTAIGKTAKKVFADLNWRPDEVDQAFEPREEEFVLYQSEKRPQWQTREAFLKL